MDTIPQYIARPVINGKRRQGARAMSMPYMKNYLIYYGVDVSEWDLWEKVWEWKGEVYVKGSDRAFYIEKV